METRITGITIAYRADRAKASVVSLIGGAERTTRVSRKVDMSALQWKVNMVNMWLN